MKKLVLFLSLLFTIGLANAQIELTYPNPPNPAPDVTLFGGPFTQISFAGFEYGAVGGVSIKDYALIGGFTQFNLRGDNFTGIYLQGNVNPKYHWFHIGYSLKTGLVNGKYIALEPAMTVQHKFNDRLKLGHAIGMVHGLPSYSITLMIGNFGKKWWRNPLMSRYMEEYKIEVQNFYLEE